MRALLPTLLVCSLALLVAPGCGGGGGAPSSPLPTVGLTLGQTPPAFALPDVNPASPTFGAAITPGQWTSYVTPWYFGWAT